MCINRFSISKALYIAYWYINYLSPNLIFLIAGRWILSILMFQVIETIGYPDYNCLFCMKPIVIWCYQAFWFCRPQRNSASYVLSCMKLILQLKTLAVYWLVLLQSRNPRCRFHTPIFHFLFSLWLAAKRKKLTNHCWLIGFGQDGCFLTSAHS